MVVDWEQETGLLMSSGDVRVIRIWDTDREMKVQVTTRSRAGPGGGGVRPVSAHPARPPVVPSAVPHKRGPALVAENQE